MSRILLVTGSRALEGSAHEPRARQILWSVCSVFEPDVLVCGDASGPDAWAAELARNHIIGLRKYALDGHVYDAVGGRLHPWIAPTKTSEPTPEPTSERQAALAAVAAAAAKVESHVSRPLERNKAMVSRCAAAMAAGSIVEAIALEATWSPTKGTASTARRARTARITVTHVSFPGAPRGARG